MKTDFARQLYTNIFIDCCLLRGFLTEIDQRKPAGYTAYCDVNGRGNVQDINLNRSSHVESVVLLSHESK